MVKPALRLLTQLIVTVGYTILLILSGNFHTKLKEAWQ